MPRCQLCASLRDFTLKGLAGHIQYKHKGVKWADYKRKYLNSYSREPFRQRSEQTEDDKDDLPWDFEFAYEIFKAANRNRFSQGEDVELWTGDIMDFMRMCIDNMFAVHKINRSIDRTNTIKSVGTYV